MCHSRTNDRKIGKLHEIFFTITNNNGQSSFKELLEKDSSDSIYERGVKILALKSIMLVIIFHLPISATLLK